MGVASDLAFAHVDTTMATDTAYTEQELDDDLRPDEFLLGDADVDDDDDDETFVTGNKA